MKLGVFKSLAGAAMALGLLAGAPASAQAQGPYFMKAQIRYDLATGAFDASVEEAPGKVAKLTSAAAIVDGAFVWLDLKIRVPKPPPGKRDPKAKSIDKVGAESFGPEPSGCTPGVYGELDMEDGLKYVFDFNVRSVKASENVSGSIYPGDRSTHWTNDVTCEFDGDANSAIFHMTGFYFVMHRTLKDKIDIQLRPVPLSPEQAARYLQPVR